MNFEIVEFKGKKIAQIKEENMKWPFRMGLKKAQLVVKYFEDIKKFVASELESEA